MVYFQNHYSIQEPVLDSILLYFAVFITRANKEIQTHRIHVALLRQYTGSYSKHMQSWIYPYLVQIQENTVTRLPLQVSIGTFLENQVFVVFLIEGYEYAALKKELFIAPFLERLLLWQSLPDKFHNCFQKKNTQALHFWHILCTGHALQKELPVDPFIQHLKVISLGKPYWYILSVLGTICLSIAFFQLFADTLLGKTLSGKSDEIFLWWPKFYLKKKFSPTNDISGWTIFPDEFAHSFRNSAKRGYFFVIYALNFWEKKALQCERTRFSAEINREVLSI